MNLRYQQLPLLSSSILLPFASSLFPSPPPIISLTIVSTSTRFTSLLTSMPIPQLVQAYRQFVCCSAKNGQQITGTPLQTLSNIEFHPQCDRKVPTAGCARTWSWGHQFAINPLSFVSSKNSSGKIAESPITKSGLTIHKNECLLFASPHANSFRCCSVITVMLP
ncbi:hypothetical protein CIPAW_04G101700 [Carya illinoinensis]|uniref:Uncharacterized protein n=1 Tax=Carya illinoinensis TaxID=32201 RepID=A0A8T1QU07_CARIL|nr:hypothetical protein CIPAW_04G101700 [Carya illinoinensis]